MDLWIQIVAGIVLVLTGKRFLWLFLGLVGFLVTHGLVLRYLPQTSGETTLILSCVGGGITAGLILLAEKIAVIGGGLLGGGYAGAVLWHILLPQAEGMYWVGIVVGAVVGFLLVRFVVKFALSVISSAIGAALLALAVPAAEYRLPVFIVLLVVGLVIQSRLFRKKETGKGQD
jgi:hypothetical protein